MILVPILREKTLPKIFFPQKIKVSLSTTIMECPCGCEIGLDDNHEAHSYSVSSLIKGCEIDSKEFDNPVPVLMKKSEVVEKA